MRKKIIILMFLMILMSITAVSAQENNITSDLAKAQDMNEVESLEPYTSEASKNYTDYTVKTHDMVKYYGDKDEKFKIEVLYKNNTPAGNVKVFFGKLETIYYGKTTGKDGIVKYNLNYKPGKYNVATFIETEDDPLSIRALNKVEIKTTIPTKELVKYSCSKKKFQIKFLDTKGKPLSAKYVKVKIRDKTYKLKTNSHGIVKIKSTRFKIGKEKITLTNPASGEKRRISVVVLKRGVHKISIKIDDPTGFFPTKTVKNGDYISTVYSRGSHHYPGGVYVMSSSSSWEAPKHTKLLKAKIYFKNKKTGKIITKTSKKVKYYSIIVKPVKGYSPYKAKVWYRDAKIVR